MLLKIKLCPIKKEFHKPFVRKFETRKLHSSFVDNSLDSDFADMQLLSNSFNKGICFLLCVINIYSEYA